MLLGCLGVVYVARLPENSTCHVSGASLQCGGEDHAVVVSEKLEFIGPVTWKMFPFGDVIITWSCCVVFAVSINFYYMLTPALTNEIINIQIKTKILLQFIFFHVENIYSNFSLLMPASIQIVNLFYSGFTVNSAWWLLVVWCVFGTRTSATFMIT